MSRSKRTKKTTKVEDKLRAALGVPASCENGNGTTKTTNSRELVPRSPTSATNVQSQSDMQEKAKSGRRSTVTFGDVRDPMNMGLEKESDVGRTRGVTIAAPSRTIRDGPELQEKVGESHNA